MSLTQVQDTLLKEIIENNDVKDYIIEYSSTSKGDNYVSAIIFVTVKAKNRSLELVMKKPHPEENLRSFLPIRDTFLNEIYVYERLLPTFYTFQKENGLEEIFDSYIPLCGNSKEEYNECLIFENIYKKGYKLWNRKVPMDSDHVSLVMKEYGKLHAVSFAMQSKNPELYNALVGGLIKEDDELNRKGFKEFIRTTCEEMKEAVKGNPHLEKFLHRITHNIEEYFFEEISQIKDQNVLIHGDCWCNNLFFKYEVSFVVKYCIYVS